MLQKGLLQWICAGWLPRFLLHIGLVSVVIGLSNSSCFFFDKWFFMLFEIQWRSPRGVCQVRALRHSPSPIELKALEIPHWNIKMSWRVAKWRSFQHLPYWRLASTHTLQISASPVSITCVLLIRPFSLPWLILIAFMLSPGLFLFSDRGCRKYLSCCLYIQWANYYEFLKIRHLNLSHLISSCWP